MVMPSEWFNQLREQYDIRMVNLILITFEALET